MRAEALAELVSVLGYVQAVVVTGACTHVPLAREMLDAQGVVAHSATRTAITETLTALLAGREQMPG